MAPTTRGMRATTSRVTRTTTKAAKSGNGTTTHDTAVATTSTSIVAAVATTAARKPNAKAKAGDSALDALADKLSRTLQIRDNESLPTDKVSGTSSRGRAGASKTKAKATALSKKKVPEPVEDPAERVRQAMTTINASSRALSAVVQSGWKASAPASPVPKKGKENAGEEGDGVPPKVYSLKEVMANVNACRDALKTMRGHPELVAKPLDVERAAASFVSKMIMLELFQLAIDFLVEMRPVLLTLYTFQTAAPSPPPPPRPRTSLPAATTPKSVRKTPATPASGRPATTSTGLALVPLIPSLLALPLPDPSAPSLDDTSLTLLATFHIHTLHALLYICPDDLEYINALCTTLANPSSPTLLVWANILPASSPPLLSTAYSLIVRWTLATPASISSPPPSCTSAHILRLRLYALKCRLAHPPVPASPPLEPDTFWEQVGKFAQAYVRDMRAAQQGEEKVAEGAEAEVMAYLNEIVQFAEAGLGAGLMQGKTWVGICEYWMLFAKKLKDFESVNRITKLLQGAAIASPSEPEDLSLLVSQLCASLIPTTTFLERALTGDVEASTFPSPGPPIQEITALIRNPSLPSDARGKLHVVIERLRRPCIKVYEILDSLRARAAEMLLELVVHAEVATKGMVVLDEDDGIRRGALDSLVTLARADTSGVRTEAFALLERCMPLVEPLPDCVKKAELMRVVSNAYYVCGVGLYKDGKGGSAIAFLKVSCSLGKRALEMARASNVGGDGEAEGNTWSSHRDLMSKRWELLGVCAAKSGERKLAFESLTQALHTLPLATFSTLTTLSGRLPIRALFAEAPLRTMATLTERITGLAVHDLFLSGADVALKLHAACPGTETEVVGAILEYQVRALETGLGTNSEVGWRPESWDAVRALLDECVQLYGQQYPVRRARVLIRHLQLSYYTNDRVVVNNYGEEAQTLLTSTDLGKDKELSPLVPTYAASVHLWLAFHTHRNDKTGEASPMVLGHAAEAARILREYIAATTPKMAGLATLPPRPGVRSKGAVTNGNPAPLLNQGGKARTVSTTKAKVVPKTPKRPTKKREVITSPSPTPESRRSTPDNPPTAPDDLDQLCNLLEMGAYLLGILGHVFLKLEFLHILRTLYERRGTPESIDGYVRASVELAYEFTTVGKTERASSVFAQILATTQDSKHRVSDEARIVFLLRFAEALASSGNIEKSLSLYTEAFELSEIVLLEKPQTVAGRVRARITALEHSALAAQVFATIQLSKDDPTAALTGLMQSLRLWNRAVDNLSRMVTPKTPVAKPAESNPFEVAPSTTPNEPIPEKASPRFPERSMVDGVQWRLAQGLINVIFALAKTYFTRGSARESEFFVQQVKELAESLNAPAVSSRALARLGELQIYHGKLDEGRQMLEQAAQLIQELPVPEAADIHRLRGYCNQIMEETDDARQEYSSASTLLSQLESLLKELETVISRRRSKEGTASSDTFAPSLVASVLRHHIWLLRDNAEDPEYQTLLERFLGLPPTPETRTEENALMGKLALIEVYTRFKADIFLSSMPDSTIAIPMGMSGGDGANPPTSTRAVLATLGNAEKHFWSTLTLGGVRGDVSRIRDTAVSLVLVRAFQTSLGNDGKDSAAIASALLDISAATTLRREFLECIETKLMKSVVPDDMVWPKLSPTGAPLPFAPPKGRRMPLLLLDHSDDSDVTASKNPTKAYWEAVRERYRSESFDLTALATRQIDLLPESWTVVSISVTADKSTMLLSRQRPRCEPLVFCLPLDRHSRREDGEDMLPFQTAVEELDDIIKSSGRNAKNAMLVEGNEAKIAWWDERKALDKRLQDLVAQIEFCWLGVFKTIFSQPTSSSAQDLEALRSRLEKVFDRNGIAKDKGQLSQLRLDDSLLECLSSLSPKCRDEELEDLAYFILDLYQLHGVPVALSEIDIDQLAVDLRTALEEHAAATTQRNPALKADHHLFLVLDRNVQAFPWESIPVLRGQSVSRIPSISFLLDRLQLARQQRGLPLSLDAPNAPNDPGTSTTSVQAVDGVIVNPKRVHYILNPGGDLKRTEGQFADWLKGMHAVGWDGIVGRAPSEVELTAALNKSDLVLYFGHNGAEQYLRGSKVRNLTRCASTMLWGCSSGALRDQGEFDRIGTPYNYMLSGCPSLVANLWDVTDRDIDKFATSVFEKLHLLDRESVGAWREGRPEKGVSIVAAVAQSREVCKLKYLTGAAPVVYGIPFYL
ncbi:hypothetical protein BOTBODRAFT_133563 [Botryobasidium botryosum FD-172 SS1]|uniref:separase n=1 Tax=Botryobasidium botryosum (strain FD-172 SS1) TaxID=930990 RepID=A0A067MCS4_BOTB1|nr:hypothetical protein BOTBODRAFT_133563 [Botryobasidium botryosum FD-172 SS1]